MATELESGARSLPGLSGIAKGNSRRVFILPRRFLFLPARHTLMGRTNHLSPLGNQVEALNTLQRLKHPRIDPSRWIIVGGDEKSNFAIFILDSSKECAR